MRFAIVCAVFAVLVGLVLPSSRSVRTQPPAPTYSYRDSDCTVDGIAMATANTTGGHIWIRARPKGYTPAKGEDIPVFRYWEYTTKTKNDAGFDVTTPIWKQYPKGTKCYRVKAPAGNIFWFAPADIMRLSDLSIPLGAGWVETSGRGYFYEDATDPGPPIDRPWFDPYLCEPNGAWANTAGCFIEEYDMEEHELGPCEEDP